MAGLPRTIDKTPPRDAFAVLVLGGVEGLTRSLMRGDPYTDRGLQDMLKLRRRLDAFGKALDARLEQEVIE